VSRLEICLISAAQPDVPCGIGDYTSHLAARLQRRGHNVAVFTTRDPRVRANAVEIVQLDTSWRLAETPAIARYVLARQPDVVHIQFPGVGYGRGFAATLLPLLLRPVRRRPIVVMTLHEFGRLTAKQRVRLAVGAAACDAVVAPDETVAISLCRATRWRPRLRVAMVPVGSNIMAPGRVKGELGLRRREDELIVGHWGFLRPDKGVETLLDAFAKVRLRRPAHLVLAGDPGPDAEYVAVIARLVHSLSIADDVTTTGPLSAERLSATLAEFDVCVLPFRDGLGQNRTTYASARAHGLYVVTTSTDRQGYDRARNTAFVRPGDPDATARAIEEAPIHPAMLPHESADATWDSIAREHVALYRAVSERGRRGRSAG
jgi:glycosyltransferase involved in cell wall biosynthesis